MNKTKDTNDRTCSISDEEWERLMGDTPENTNDNQPEFEGKAANEAEAKAKYKVGYKNPPKQTQFKPGQSGNPKGRPKGKSGAENSRELRAGMMKQFSLPVTINIDGKKETMPLHQAIYRQIALKAAKGHLPSVRLVDQRLHESVQGHEQWRAELEEYKIQLLEIMASQPEGKKGVETVRYFNWVMEQLNTTITGEEQ